MRDPIENNFEINNRQEKLNEIGKLIDEKSNFIQ